MKINPSLEAGDLPLSGSAELLPAIQSDFPQGYRLPDDCTDPSLIQRYIAAQMGRTVEACLEIGRGLIALKALCAHGEFLNRIGELGLESRTSQRFMAAFRRLSRASFAPLLAAVGKQTKLFELLPLDDAQLEELAQQGRVGPLALSDIPAMTVVGMREAVHQCLDVSRTAEGQEGVEADVEEGAARHDAAPDDVGDAGGDARQQTPEPSEVAASVDAILAQAVRIGNHASEDAKSAIQLGWILIAAKRQVPQGHFCEFITNTLGISRCVASRMMKAAMLFPDIDKHPEVCELGFSKLTELLWEDEQAVRGLVDGGRLAGHTLADFKAMTVREVRQAIKEASRPCKEVAAAPEDPAARRKAYLVARVATLVRFAEDGELNILDDVLDELVSDISNSRFVPGLVAEDYALTHRFLVSGGAQ